MIHPILRHDLKNHVLGWDLDVIESHLDVVHAIEIKRIPCARVGGGGRGGGGRRLLGLLAGVEGLRHPPEPMIFDDFDTILRCHFVTILRF
jgi:hypothetical protein